MMNNLVLVEKASLKLSQILYQVQIGVVDYPTTCASVIVAHAEVLVEAVAFDVIESVTH